MSISVNFPGTGFQGPPGPPGPGFTRSVNVISSATNAGAVAGTDYLYFCTGTFTLTLPTAVGNTNGYFVINSGTGVITVATTAGQTINGSATYPLSAQNQSASFFSNSANWGAFAGGASPSPPVTGYGAFNFSTASNSGIFAGAL